MFCLCSEFSPVQLLQPFLPDASRRLIKPGMLNIVVMRWQNKRSLTVRCIYCLSPDCDTCCQTTPSAISPWSLCNGEQWRPFWLAKIINKIICFHKLSDLDTKSLMYRDEYNLWPEIWDNICWHTVSSVTQLQILLIGASRIVYWSWPIGCVNIKKSFITFLTTS